jgi:adenylate cyclase
VCSDVLLGDEIATHVYSHAILLEMYKALESPWNVVTHKLFTSPYSCSLPTQRAIQGKFTNASPH